MLARSLWVAAATMATILACVLTFADTARAGSATLSRDHVFTVYMAPPELGGDDVNDGLTMTAPVASVLRVHEVLKRTTPETDVEVRIQPGTYHSPPMEAWRFFVPGRTVSFLPVDYAVGEDIDGYEARPVFRNTRCGKSYCDGTWLTARPPLDEDDPMYDGGDSGLRFYHLTFEYYSAAAISIKGDSERKIVDRSYSPPLRKRGSTGLNGNVFEGLVIRRIGNRWSEGGYGWGGIVLTNSSGNRIEDNTFSRIENVAPHGGYIHGVYLTHFSSDNVLRKNRFEVVSGDPIKVRNRSNDNTVERNRFRRTGVLSYYRDEFCDSRCARAHDIAQQCPSYGNRFIRNRLEGGYNSGEMDVWSMGSGSFPYSSRSVCKPPNDRPPLQTAQNG